MKLAEPATTITDYILSFETYLLAVLLLLEGISRWQNSVLLWGVAFLAIATPSTAPMNPSAMAARHPPRDTPTKAWAMLPHTPAIARSTMN